MSVPALTRATTMLIVSLLAGCSGAVKHAPTDRLGWVKAIIEGTEITDPAAHPCVAPLATEAMAARRWVVVGLPDGRYRQLRTVPLPEGVPLVPGDRVRIDLTDCSVPLRRSE